MAKTEEYNCSFCGKKFTARVADRNRGWARFCSKSCKAKKQTRNDVDKMQRSPYRRIHQFDPSDEDYDPDSLLGLTDADFGYYPGEALDDDTRPFR